MEELKTEEIAKYKNCISFIIVVATEVEIKEVQANLTALPGEKDILFIEEDETYYLGCFGEYGVAVVQSAMGSGAPGGAILATSAAIDFWNPKAVVMLGIAFGVNPKKQQIGDVLVSEIILPYELSREGKNEIIPRSAQPSASLQLVNRFKNAREWDHRLPNGNKAEYEICSILSGEKLIDNKDYRDILVKRFPTAKGGEMEGAGIYAASDRNKVDWIVVKGICDYADGKKNKKKKEHQQIAIKSAVSLAKLIFSRRYAFENLGFILAEECFKNKNNSAGSSSSSMADSQKMINDGEANTLRNWVTQNRLAKVLEFLVDKYKAPGYSAHLTEINALQQQFNTLNRNQRLGIISYDEAQRTSNRITISTLNFISENTAR